MLSPIIFLILVLINLSSNNKRYSLRVLERSPTSIKLQFPDSQGGVLMYVKVACQEIISDFRIFLLVQTRHVRTHDPPWEVMVILPGSDVVSLTNLETRTSYTLRWRTQERVFSDVSVRTMISRNFEIVSTRPTTTTATTATTARRTTSSTTTSLSWLSTASAQVSKVLTTSTPVVTTKSTGTLLTSTALPKTIQMSTPTTGSTTRVVKTSVTPSSSFASTTLEDARMLSDEENTSVSIFPNTTTNEASSAPANKSLDVKRDNKSFSLQSRPAPVVTVDQIIKNISSYPLTSQSRQLWTILNQTNCRKNSSDDDSILFSGSERKVGKSKRNFAWSLQRASSEPNLETNFTNITTLSASTSMILENISQVSRDRLPVRNMLWYPAPPPGGISSTRSTNDGDNVIQRSNQRVVSGSQFPGRRVTLSSTPQLNYPIKETGQHNNSFIRRQEQETIIESGLLTVEEETDDKLDLSTSKTISTFPSGVQNIESQHRNEKRNSSSCDLQLKHKYLRQDTLMIFWSLCEKYVWNLIIYNEVEIDESKLN